jgi:hypothetical protein
MSYSLAEAAKATGLYKSTILRSIKAGRLTGTKDALGQWQIRACRAAPRLCEQRLADLKAVLDDMKAQRDKWQVQAEATQRLLLDATAKRPWWRRIAG